MVSFWMATNYILTLIDRLAQEGYEPDHLKNAYVCFNSKKFDAVVRICQYQDCSIDGAYGMQFECTRSLVAGSYNWASIIEMLNHYGIMPDIPTKGVFDESRP